MDVQRHVARPHLLRLCCAVGIWPSHQSDDTVTAGARVFSALRTSEVIKLTVRTQRDRKGGHTLVTAYRNTVS